MSVTLKTGAFGPIIPRELASRQPHNLFHDLDETQRVVPEAYNIQKTQGAEIDYRLLLDLMWTVKTFDIKTIWQYKNITSLPNVTFNNGNSGENTRLNVDIFNKEIPVGASGASEYIPWVTPLPKNPWTNNPLIGAMKWTEYVTELYPVDVDEARNELREIIKNVGISTQYDVIFALTPYKGYEAQREQLFENFEALWQAWNDKIAALKAFFQNDLSVRGNQFNANLDRQSQETIPELYPFYSNLLSERIAPLDLEADNPITTDKRRNELIAALLREEEIFFNLIISQQNLEMFDLYGGFKNQINFFKWNESKLYEEYGYPKLSFDGFPSSVNGREGATGATGESAQINKHKHDVAAFLQPVIGGGFSSYETYETRVKIYDPFKDNGEGNPPGGIVVETVEMNSEISFTPSTGRFQGFSLSPTRGFNYLQTTASSTLTGGTAGNGSVSFDYGSFFNNYGLPDEEELPPLTNFTPDIVGIPLPEGITDWNDVIYSGFLDYNTGYGAIREFFYRTAEKARTLNDQLKIIGEVGKLRFLNETGELITEVPIFGSVMIWQNVTIEYKINQRWDFSE